MELTGLQALITIVIQLGFIWIAFYALQGLHMERWFRRPPKTLPLLMVLLATECQLFIDGSKSNS